MTPDSRIIPVGHEPPPMHPRPPRPAKLDRAGKPAKDRPAGDRFGTLNAFVDFTLAGLTRAELAVWLILFRDTREGAARTSYDDLAGRAGCDRRNVGRALRGLKQKGLLVTVGKGGLRHGPSTYRVRPLAR